MVSLMSMLRGQLVDNQIQIFFVEKMTAKAFCTAKASHIFSTKNISTFELLTFKILMSRKLTTLLVLKNQAQLYNHNITF